MTPGAGVAGVGLRPATAQVDAGKHQVLTPPPQGHAPAAPRRGIGLCLSGGGYRAALFHLGALRRLDELGVLAAVRTVTGVSGGSLAAAMLLHPELGWDASSGRVGGFDALVAEPLRRLAATNVRTPALLSRLRPDRWTTFDGAARGLAAELARAVPWWGRPLGELPALGPAVVIVATEVGYGLDWHFCAPTPALPRGLVGDYRLGVAPPPADLTVADALSASCAFPPVFAPRTYDGQTLGLAGGTPGAETDAVRAAIAGDIRLTDGGVYDNLGVEPVWKDHETVLVSDGGPVFRPRTTWSPLGRVSEAISLAADSSTSVRLRWLHTMMASQELQGATWALDDGPEDYSREVLAVMAAVRTDLDAFTPGEQEVLERHGYLVAEAAVRAHAPELHPGTPSRPPHPHVADPERVLAALHGSARRTLLGRR